VKQIGVEASAFHRELVDLLIEPNFPAAGIEPLVINQCGVDDEAMEMDSFQIIEKHSNNALIGRQLGF
jgi:hypothetical protein